MLISVFCRPLLLRWRKPSTVSAHAHTLAAVERQRCKLSPYAITAPARRLPQLPADDFQGYPLKKMFFKYPPFRLRQPPDIFEDLPGDLPRLFFSPPPMT